ncbi:MAG TPA: polysaccharide deacetylase family protein [Rhizomicrobium sp.]|jgi:peptidoglycan/xylan/chitin deacetylase (PgdA/CDA1 family)|nr:polysaccharide deacetylase family protein [Rhizomicrobium sp.]
MMGKILSAIAWVLALGLLASTAAEAQPVAHAPNADLAFFQPRNIFHSGLRHSHVVALTFDDGPNQYTPAVLDVLKAEGVKATFFIVGRMAKAYPDILTRIAREGHLLGNHSATHPFLGESYAEHPDRLLDQIRDVDELIAPLMRPGTKFYFRAPYGSWRPEFARELNADPDLRKYVGPIYWDEGGEISFSDDGYVLSSSDWDCWHRGWDAATCAKGYMREIRRKDGGVVLMHCIHAQSAALVAAVVPPLIEEGYTFVRLDQLPGYRQYETPPEDAGPEMASAAGRTINSPR